MKVTIKKFEVPLEVKNNGIEFKICPPNGGAQIGDLILSKTGLTWCQGGIAKANGKFIEWNDFITYMNGRL